MASATLFSWIILVFSYTMACGFEFNDPCSFMTNKGPSKGHTFNWSVPKSCKNGKFWWNYPEGTINLQFHQRGNKFYSICIKDSLGGDIFTMVDVTSGGHVPLKKLTKGSDEESCTESHLSDIKIKFNAPDAPEAMVFMGEVVYRVEM